jgi:hypothetical protein
VRDIDADLVRVEAWMRAGNARPITNVEELYYLLRALHAIADSLERIADAYCAENPTVPWPGAKGK